MTDNLPAVREPDRTPAVADVDSWIDVMAPVVELANRINGTEFVPKGLRGSSAATAAAMLYGREVGLPPMTALTQTHVIEGKPSVSAEAMRALIIAAGHVIEFVESTSARCVMRGRRAGTEQWTTVEWNIDMARAAGLLNKSNWKAYPHDMLVARCTARLAKMVYPDVIHGFRAIEEVQDENGDGGPVEQLTAAASGTSKVSRRRKPAQLPPAEAPKPTEPPPTSAMPLPGEPGYDAMTTQTPVAGDASTGDGTKPAEPAPISGGDETVGTADDDAADDDGTGGPTAADDSSEAVDVGPHDEDASSPTAEDAPGEADAVPPPRAPSRAQSRMMMGQLSVYGIADDDEERRHVAAVILNRPVESFTTLTAAEVSLLIDTFGRCKTRADLYALLDSIEGAEKSERGDQ